MDSSETRPLGALNLPDAFAAALRKKSIHLVSGKGGVGRTSCSVGLARALAQQGYRTLIAEVDDESDGPSALALALGDLSSTELTPDAVQIAPRLHAIRLTGRKGQELFLTSIFKMESIARSLLGMDALSKLARVAPSLRELGVFYHLGDCMKKLSATRGDFGEYDRIVLDLPATGHFLGMTALPELILDLLPRGPIAQALKEGQRYLYDPELTAAWVVTLPESLPMEEALELVEGLQKHHLHVEGVLVNRLPALVKTLEDSREFESVRGLAGAGSVAAFRLAEAVRVLRVLTERSSVPVGTIAEMEFATDTSECVRGLTHEWNAWLNPRNSR